MGSYHNDNPMEVFTKSLDNACEKYRFTSQIRKEKNRKYTEKFIVKFLAEIISKPISCHKQQMTLQNYTSKQLKMKKKVRSANKRESKFSHPK